MKKIRISALLIAIVMLFSCLSVSAAEEQTFDFLPEIKAGKVYGFPVNSTEKDVHSIFRGADILVTDSNGKTLKQESDEKIGTGFSVMINGSPNKIVIMGDVNGDGKMNATDYIYITRCYLGTLELDSLQLDAAGVKEGEKLRAVHYVKVKRACFDTYDINNEYSCIPYVPGSLTHDGYTPGWI